MFWRFGFHNASTIDSLLDKEDVPLEAILDEDDLLQECKSQNTRLIDYFGRVLVLHKLLAYVTGEIESEDKGRFKYPYVATEVLCSDIWSIVETCLHEQHDLLTPFWEAVLDRSPDDMKTQMVMASHFAKINAVFLNKKPAEMLAFVQSQPCIVERLLRHIETPSFVDLLVQIIQLDEQPGGGGVLEWLSSENFMGRLIDMLGPEYSNDIHTIVADLIKGIISMATPSPAAGLTDAVNGPASNLFARELASRESVGKFASYIVHDFGPPSNSAEETRGDDMTTAIQLPTLESSISSVVNSISIIIELIRKNNSDYFEPYLFHTLRNRLIQLQQQLHGTPEETRDILEQAMKDMVNRMGVVHLGPVLEGLGEKMANLKQFLHSPRSLAGDIQTTVGPVTPLTFERFRICELFAELLHCSNMALLNRPSIYDHLYDSKGRLQGGLSALEDLAQVIALNGTSDNEREQMDETSDIEPALELPISGSHDDSPSIDSEDMTDSSGPESSDEDDGAMEEVAMYNEPRSVSPVPPEAGLSGAGSMRQTKIVATPPGSASPILTASPTLMGMSVGMGVDKGRERGSGTDLDLGFREGDENALVPQPSRPPIPSRSPSSRRSSRKTTMQEPFSPAEIVMTPGNKLKRWFLDLGLLSTLLDLFFEFRWNNFLHSAVYDVIHQILTGNVESGLNRELAISLFRDAKLMQRIVDGQKLNDIESTKPKGVRIGYMGHLTLLAEDVIISLERFPPDLRITIDQYAPKPEWEQYVTGRFSETKQKDSHLLGGGKPVVGGANGSGVGRGLGLATRWKVDEDDADVPEDVGPGARGEFRRVSGEGGVGGGVGGVRNTADFGPAPIPVDEDEDEDDEEKYGNSRTTHFARYLAQEIQSSNHIGESSDSSDEEEGGWLSQSNFTLGSPPISARRQPAIERRPLDAVGFDDAFTPSGHNNTFSQDPFTSHDDDAFGPFSDTAATTNSDSIIISSSFSDEMDDSSFESFGDFGDFQSADGDVDFGQGFGGVDEGHEGGNFKKGRRVDASTSTIRSGSDEEGDGNDSLTLTPTTGSWTISSGHDGFEEIRRVERYGEGTQVDDGGKGKEQV